MKKAFYRVSTILQVLFLVTAFGIQWFSVKKMGMMRYVVYINRQWEAQYPITAIRNIAIAFLALFLITVTLYVLIKKGQNIFRKKELSMLITGVVATLAFTFFTLLYSTETYRSYYFTALILAIIALIQNIKILVYLQKA